jgi:hypothetical protein
MDNGSRLSKSLLSCRPLRAEGETAAFHKMFALPFAKGEVKFIREKEERDVVLPALSSHSPLFLCLRLDKKRAKQFPQQSPHTYW